MFFARDRPPAHDTITASGYLLAKQAAETAARRGRHPLAAIQFEEAARQSGTFYQHRVNALCSAAEQWVAGHNPQAALAALREATNTLPHCRYYAATGQPIREALQLVLDMHPSHQAIGIIAHCLMGRVYEIGRFHDNTDAIAGYRACLAMTTTDRTLRHWQHYASGRLKVIGSPKLTAQEAALLTVPKRLLCPAVPRQLD